jgi:hypothetical protein
VPRRKVVGLIVDTGARYCTLKPELIEELAAACLTFPLGTLAPLPAVLVAGLPMPADLAAYDGVIGRNVLRGWESFYSGPRQLLTIRDRASFWGWLLS